MEMQDTPVDSSCPSPPLCPPSPDDDEERKRKRESSNGDDVSGGNTRALHEIQEKARVIKQHRSRAKKDRSQKLHHQEEETAAAVPLPPPVTGDDPRLATKTSDEEITATTSADTITSEEVDNKVTRRMSSQTNHLKEKDKDEDRIIAKCKPRQTAKGDPGTASSELIVQQQQQQNERVVPSPTPEATDTNHKTKMILAVKHRRRSRQHQSQASDEATAKQKNHQEAEPENTPLPEGRSVQSDTRGKETTERATEMEQREAMSQAHEPKKVSSTQVQKPLDVKQKAEIHETVRKRQRKLRQQRYKGLGVKSETTKRTGPSQTVPVTTVQAPITTTGHADRNNVDLDRALADVQSAALVIQNAALSIQSAAGTLFETVAALRGTMTTAQDNGPPHPAVSRDDANPTATAPNEAVDTKTQSRPMSSE